MLPSQTDEKIEDGEQKRSDADDSGSASLVALRSCCR